MLSGDIYALCAHGMGAQEMNAYLTVLSLFGFLCNRNLSPLQPGVPHGIALTRVSPCARVGKTPLNAREFGTAEFTHLHTYILLSSLFVLEHLRVASTVNIPCSSPSCRDRWLFFYQKI